MLIGAALDLSRSLTATDKEGQAYTVQLARLLMSASGYVPLVPTRRVVLALSGRAGGILKSADSQVIGTRRFFLGGNQSLRGFNEDAVYPEDVRERLHAAFVRCRALASGLGCDDTSRRLASGEVDSSPGGTLSLLVRSELRFGVRSDLDGALFVDAGNLWSDAARADLRRLRASVGAGLRYLLPIGPVALDCGYNLDRDTLLSEPPLRVHLSVGLF